MTDPIDKAVAELLPEPPEMTAAAYDHGLGKLNAAIGTTGTDLVTALPPRVLSRRRFLPLAAGAAAVFAAGTAFVVARGDGERALAARFKDPAIDQYQYLYMRQESIFYAGDKTNVGLNTVETWIPADRHRDWQRTVHSSMDNGTAAPEIARSGRFRFGGTLPDLMDSLPRDPDKLIRQLASTKNKAPTELFGLVKDLFMTPPPADLRGPLLEVLARQPDVVITENVKSVDGRPSIRATQAPPPGGSSRSVFLAPDTGLLIGWQAAYAPGEPDAERTTATYAVVNGMGIRP
ncbi:hypothetical protein AB5J62_39265 [Amycolatopsis sp. cg5]|uniref:hypothetical protein n=1 Tax=Amycolatopsis sp. cg5 TaxID=3238802 RepID=UPI0035250082